jgi:hypothetical protein
MVLRPTITDPLAGYDLDSVGLLSRLLKLVALLVAHHECHPYAYNNPSGQILKEQMQVELRVILGGGPPPDSTL